MASSLSNLLDNLSEGIHKIKCTNSNKCYNEYTNFKDVLIEFKCLCCNKNYQKRFDENLKKKFANTYKFAIQYINKLISLLQKSFYPHEYIDHERNSMRHHYQKRMVFIVI